MAQQQNINIRKSSPVPGTEQEHIIEGSENFNTPPRRRSSVSIQQTSPNPSTSVQPIPSNVSFVFIPEAVQPLSIAPPRKATRG